jgi:signal transduction histidine kinase
MLRVGLSLFLLTLLTLLAFGALADRAIQGEAARAREKAALAAGETARLSALSVRAALAQTEQRVLWARAEPGVAWERLANPPARSVPEPGFVPYARRSRGELARLLDSAGATASGLPEAVVARIALGAAAPVTVSGERPPPDVAERLLSGRLPVRPEDLHLLARELGVPSDPRVPSLEQRLRAAPDPATLPRSPGFRRARRGAGVEGWTTLDGVRVRYEVSLVRLLEKARLAAEAIIPPTAATGDAQAEESAAVPDVAGLFVHVTARAPELARIRALRAGLWLAIAASIASLVAVRRSLAAEARATAREKAFLSSVTHELRTPLAAIRLFGERLAEGRGDAREYGGLVAEESRRLEGLVERVLSATRAAERPSLAPVEPDQVLRSAVALVMPRAERRGVTLTCDTEAQVPTATWDGEAVRHALLNLLDNAIKHGREGGYVEARARVEGDLVCLSVSDDGPGIGRRERGGLFRRFARGLTEAPGTGLGLHFVEQVAHAHGGRVDLRTEMDRGCVFTLRLPVVPPAREAAS